MPVTTQRNMGTQGNEVTLRIRGREFRDSFDTLRRINARATAEIERHKTG